MSKNDFNEMSREELEAELLCAKNMLAEVQEHERESVVDLRQECISMEYEKNELQKQLDLEIRKSGSYRNESNRLYAIANSTADIVIEMNSLGIISWVNYAFEREYHIEKDDIVGRDYVDFLKQDHVDEQTLQILSMYVRREVEERGQLFSIRRRGDERAFYDHQFVLPEGSEMMLVIERNQSEALLAEEQSRVAFEENEVVLDSFSGGVVCIDRYWEVFKWSKNASSYLGIDGSTYVGKYFHEVDFGFDNKSLIEFIKKYMAQPYNAGSTYEFNFNNKDNEQRSALITLHQITTGTNKGGVILVILDITDKRDLEKDLYHAQKMEAVGQLSAGVAHEINTPIQFIGDNLRFIEESIEDISKFIESCYKQIVCTDDKFMGIYKELVSAADIEYLSEEMPSAVSQSIEGVARVAKIVRAMKEFSHPGENEKELCPVQDCIQGAVTMAQNEYKYYSDVECDIPSDIPMVECCKNEIIQVILILIVNASHAIQDCIEKTEMERGLIKIFCVITGEFLTIKIVDNGIGIPDELQGKIFNAFFTTKDAGKGTGQGLSLAHKIIYQNHGGQIDVHSILGEGTTFSIKIPMHASEAAHV
ncbi:MAG: PAS domain S-box protein [Planctomycetes bacterium]|nr:PAS domain S-box protein [Planctomycetota bacterium]